MVILVDGHNAIHRLRIRRGLHEDHRRELLHLVRQIDPAAEVFFDARRAPAGLPASSREEGIRVVYCREGEADRAILERVRGSVRPADVTVVTDDQEVAGGTRQLGGKSISIRAFFAPGPDHAPGGEEEEGGERGPGGFSPEDFGLPGQINLKHPPRDLRRER